MSTSPAISRYFASASSGVLPTIGEHPGRISTSAGLRPATFARPLTSALKASKSARVAWPVNTASAMDAANPRPASDDPACISTGRPWGEREMFSGPWTEKNSPAWSSRCILSGSMNCPLAWSRMNASSSHESHSPLATSMYSEAIR